MSSNPGTTARRSRRSSTSSRPRPRRGPGFVPAADRIATFDNDGTLWVEQPMPPQFDFVFRKWAEEVQADPSLASQQPYKAIIEKDPAFFEGVATQDPEVVATLLGGVRPLVGGHDAGRVRRAGARVAATVKQPKFGVAVRRARLQADARAVRPTCRRTSSGCSSAPAAAATSCASSPRRPGASTRRT